MLSVYKKRRVALDASLIVTPQDHATIRADRSGLNEKCVKLEEFRSKAQHTVSSHVDVKACIDKVVNHANAQWSVRESELRRHIEDVEWTETQASVVAAQA